jgi:hypothetical protein
MVSGKTGQIIPASNTLTTSENSALRLLHYREATAARDIRNPVISHHRLVDNEERLKLRYDLERQLTALTARAEEAMYHHNIEENSERLKLRYHLDRQRETAAVLTKKVMVHHEIEQNIERIKLQYRHICQPEPVNVQSEIVPVKSLQAKAGMEKVKTSGGLFQDKIGWTRYMKQTLGAILQEKKQGQPVPVMACSWNSTGIPGRIRTDDPLLRRQPLYPTELQGHTILS